MHRFQTLSYPELVSGSVRQVQMPIAIGEEGNLLTLNRNIHWHYSTGD